MLEQTNEAPAPEVVEVYPDDDTRDLAEALDAKIKSQEAEIEAATAADETPELSKDDIGTPAGTQAEEVSASIESDPPEADGKPEVAPDAEEGEPEVDLKGLPDEWKGRLLKAREAGVMSDEELAQTKELVLKGMGFDRGMRDLAEQRKELQGKAERGDQFDAMFTDSEERDAYLAWRERQDTQPEEEATEIPTFDSDEDLIRYVEERASRIAEQRVLDAERRKAEAAQADESAAAAMIDAVEGHFSTLDGVEADDYRGACELLNEEIRADGQLPWQILNDPDVVARKIQPHLDRVMLKKRLAALEDKLKVRANEQSKSEAARSAGVSSPPGISTRTDAEYPDTEQGRAARTLAELGGRLPQDF